MRLEAAVGDRLAELGDGAEVAVARPLAGELASQVLAEDVGRRRAPASSSWPAPHRGWSRGSITRSCSRCDSSAMRHWRSASLSWCLLIVPLISQRRRCRPLGGELGVRGAGSSGIVAAIAARGARREHLPSAATWHTGTSALRSAQAWAGLSGFGFLMPAACSALPIGSKNCLAVLLDQRLEEAPCRASRPRPRRCTGRGTRGRCRRTGGRAGTSGRRASS